MKNSAQFSKRTGYCRRPSWVDLKNLYQRETKSIERETNSHCSRTRDGICGNVIQSSVHRITRQSSCCPLTGKGNYHGKPLKGDSCCRNSCRKHRIPSIGCAQEQSNFCSSERICRAKQARKRRSCFCLGTSSVSSGGGSSWFTLGRHRSVNACEMPVRLLTLLLSRRPQARPFKAVDLDFSLSRSSHGIHQIGPLFAKARGPGGTERPLLHRVRGARFS